MNSNALSPKGCLTCQLQKVTCDGAKPKCSRCETAAFDCLWQDPTPNQPPQERIRKACLPCRRRKVRCAGPVNSEEDSPCPRCERLSLVCSWTNEKSRRGIRHSVEPSRRGSSAEPIVNDNVGFIEPDVQSLVMTSIGPTRSDAVQSIISDRMEVQSILRTYFGTVHYFGFLSFIHEPTLFRLLEQDKHPKDLVSVMVACTLRLGGSRLPDALARADVLFQTVLQKVQKQVYEVYGAIELMTVVLLRQFEQMRGHYSSAWMLWGNAVKMMQFLSLHIYDEVYSQPHTIKLNNLLTPEALRRLAWAVFFLDSMGDAGRHGVHTVTEEAYHIQLPCDEEAFARGIEMRTECLKRPEDVSILSPTGQTPTHGPVLGVSAHIIKTAAFRRRICHYKSRIKYMTASADAMLTDLAGMEAELKLLMAELPPDLVYSDDNLYIHPERRTAFILLHALRHNCFIMLAESRLIACSRDPNLHESGYAWMRDRVRHAYPVASIISDALRLGIVCDPFIGALSYTAIEVLLFDPPRLAKHDPSVDPKSYELIRALRKLLEMIRVQGAVDDGMKHMRIEACRRIIRRGLGEEILNQEDFHACQSDQFASGDDDAEFDWRLFRWHRLEQTTKIPNAAKNPWAAEAILDLDAKPISRAPSRRPSPRPDQVDASAVSSRPENPVMTLFGGDNVSPVVGLDPAEADLFGNVHSSLHGQNTLSFAEGNWSFEDNFSRFMEQAGYTTVNEGESLPWLPV